jgi:hypothetical protein
VALARPLLAIRGTAAFGPPWPALFFLPILERSKRKWQMYSLLKLEISLPFAKGNFDISILHTYTNIKKSRYLTF